jgi:hypothetical protein
MNSEKESYCDGFGQLVSTGLESFVADFAERVRLNQQQLRSE